MKLKYFIFLLFTSLIILKAQKQDFIIDADTGNEMDDLYAIVRAINNDKINIIGLTSAHFNNTQLLTDEYWHIYPTTNINTVKISQELNEQLLEMLERGDIPHPLGCDRIVGYSWGFYEGAPIPNSPAVTFIINQAKNYSKERKLNIVCLGAVTNVAAAILLDSTITNKIRLYALTMRIGNNGAWNKNSFNARNDINALDIVLNDPTLELVVIPGNVSRNLVFDRYKTQSKLNKINTPLSKILHKRWDEVSAGNTWIMWDLALIESIINPSNAQTIYKTTPPENYQRKIGVINKIDVEKIKNNFWESLIK